MQVNQDFTDALHDLRVKLDMEFAIIAHIVGEQYTVLAVESDLGTIEKGAVFETTGTYCNETVKLGKSVCYPHVGSVEALRLHPCYTALQLEAYIASPLRIAGEIVGTVNFSSFAFRDHAFSEAEIAEVEALAKQIEAALSQ